MSEGHIPARHLYKGLADVEARDPVIAQPGTECYLKGVGFKIVLTWALGSIKDQERLGVILCLAEIYNSIAINPTRRFL